MIEKAKKLWEDLWYKTLHDRRGFRQLQDSIDDDIWEEIEEIAIEVCESALKAEKVAGAIKMHEAVMDALTNESTEIFDKVCDLSPVDIINKLKD